jgi:predicted nucleic acid-binding protein
VSIDLATLIRRHKPEKRLNALTSRARSQLLTLADAPEKARLVVDTGIYIAQAAGTLTQQQSRRLAHTELHHCTVCLGEIAVGLANRDVTASTWPAERRHWEGLFRAIPRSRTHAPDADVWAAAGLLAGTLTRLQRFQPHQRKDALNDALIFLTAAKAGLAVITENRRDFDWLQQLVPDGRFYLL